MLTILKSFRIILDRVESSSFLINDGAAPANSDAGYITRRLLRRAIRAGKKSVYKEVLWASCLKFI